MNATFEKRLRTRPVKHRLGKMPTTRKIPDVDLRQKLSSTIRTLDARSVIRNRRRSRVFTNRDARNILQKRPRANPRGSSSRVPFMVPIKTVKNDLFTQGSLNRARIGVAGRAPIRRNQAAHIPDLLSLPVGPSSFLQNAGGANRLFANIANPSETMVTLTSGTGNKLSPIQGFRVEVRNLQPSVSLDDVFELFSSIGTLRLCNLVRPGHAQVVFNELADANEAVRRYNGRELDGRPMSVSLVTQLPSGMGTAMRFASRLGPVASPGAVSFQSAGALANKWRQGDPPAKLLHTGLGGSKSKSTMEIDMDVVRKALFNVSSGSTARKPVDFNVSLR